jgi:hypothetical protein
LLEFETDLAQLTDLVLLFCESEGSLAELGAFAMVDEIRQRTLVVMRDKHYKQDSFIILGPILALTNKYGDQIVYVLDDDDINITGSVFGNLNIDTLKARLKQPIEERLSEAKDPTTFNRDRSGHVIKLIVGLIQEFGALTLGEIHEMLASMGLEIEVYKINSYLLCAEAVEWISSDKKGANTYYFSRSLKRDAAQYIFRSDVPEKNKVVRRLSIRAFWEDNDPDRFRGIVKYSGETA